MIDRSEFAALKGLTAAPVPSTPITGSAATLENLKFASDNDFLSYLDNFQKETEELLSGYSASNK